jgi:carbon storage regulator CsrA
MLVLGRKKGDRVALKFGEHVVMATVVQITGKSVRLGFDGPLDVAIHRGEVFDLIQQEETKRGK